MRCRSPGGWADSREMSDDYRPPTAQVIRWVEAATGARVLRHERLHGGLTAQMDRLAFHSGHRDLVLRRWRTTDEWGPGLVRRESAALLALADQELPTPRLVAADPDGESAGTPSLLMTALPGAWCVYPRNSAEFVRQLACMMARIHNVPTPHLAPSDPHGYEPSADRGWIGDAALTRILEEAADNAVNDEPAVLIHGDYHPLNILWAGNEISGVVDWTYTGSGSRATDVGHCRLALAVLFSPAAAEQFLRWYESESGQHVNSAQDIRALLAFNHNWHEIAEHAVGSVDHAGMADRVVAVLTAAARRLG